MTVPLSMQRLPRIPRIRAIQQTVAQFYEMPTAAMWGRDRTGHVAGARQIAMRLARKLTKYSLDDVARSFARNRGTVIHAIQAVESRVILDARFRAEYVAVEQRVVAALVSRDVAAGRTAA